MKDNYSLAVDCVVEAFKGRIKNGQIASVTVEPTELLYKFGLRIEQSYDGKMTSYTYLPGAEVFLCMKAESDKGAYDILCSIVASKLFLNEKLSDPLRVFAGLKVAGLKPPPKGRKVAKTFLVNLHLLALTKSIESRFGLSATRNEVSPPSSACDAVSEGLGKLGHQRSWRAIKELVVNQSSEELRLLEGEIREYAFKAIREDPAILAKWKSDSARAGRDGDR
jgi:hypothetical protein